jgi:hypothetical protein
MSDDDKSPQKNRRAGIFFPILIIAIGVYFLLVMMGVFSGDTWVFLVRLWPVLLILAGIDSIFRRQGMVGGTLAIVLGIIFLLSNFGYIAASVWQLILMLWPLFLVAAGFDLIFSRRSIWFSLAGVAIFLVLLVGLLWYGGVLGNQASQGVAFQQPLEGASQASVLLKSSVGTFDIADLDDPDLLAKGRLPDLEFLPIQQSYAVSGSTGNLELVAEGEGVIRWNVKQPEIGWNLDLNSKIPTDFRLDFGAGSADLHLQKNILSFLGVNYGVGGVTLYLPESGSFDGDIQGGVGVVRLIVPEGVGLKFTTQDGLTARITPSDYQRDGNVTVSPGYDDAERQIELTINNGVGVLIVEEQ